MPPFTQTNKPTLRENVSALMSGKVGKTRQKGIITLAKRRNIPRTDARFQQAVAIAKKK